MNQIRVKAALPFLAALLVLSVAAYAQSDAGSITGFVKDPSGAVVPAAKVAIRNEATGVERQTTTNETGYYPAFPFSALTHNSLRASDAFIHMGFNTMKTLWRSTPNG